MTEQNKSYQSYALGYSVGQNLSENGIEGLEYDRFVEGVKASLLNLDPEGSIEELNEAVQSLLKEASEKRSKGVVAEGLAYLSENGQRSEVTTLDSGLQYEVLTNGDGASPTSSDSVTTHYHGMLVNGEVFDSSVERNQPASFPVGGVIAGWTEALQLMQVGAKWRLSIPSDLAYGGQAAGSIPPHSTLIFDVELLGIN